MNNKRNEYGLKSSEDHYRVIKGFLYKMFVYDIPGETSDKSYYSRLYKNSLQEAKELIKELIKKHNGGEYIILKSKLGLYHIYKKEGPYIKEAKREINFPYNQEYLDEYFNGLKLDFLQKKLQSFFHQGNRKSKLEELNYFLKKNKINFSVRTRGFDLLKEYYLNN